MSRDIQGKRLVQKGNIDAVRRAKEKGHRPFPTPKDGQHTKEDIV